MRTSQKIATDVLGFASAVITYLLRDDFTDTVSAGSVNGTAATPGPGTRIGADTNNVATIGSGFYSVAPGGVGVADPALSYQIGGFTKGRVALVRAKFTSATNTRIGFHDVPGRALSENFRASTAARLYANTTEVASYANDTLYTLSFAFGDETARRVAFFMGNDLLWISKGFSALSPSHLIINSESSTDDYDIKFSRVPDVLWFPAPLASDGFGSTFGTTDGLGHTETSGIGSGGSGLTWTTHSGSITTAAGMTTGLGRATVDTGETDVLIAVDVTRTAGGAGLLARFVDDNNWLSIVRDGTNIVVSQKIAGTVTALSTNAVTYVAGARLVARISGTSYRIYYNNAFVVSGTFNATLTGTRHGLYVEAPGNTLDNFTAYAATGYTELNQYAS